jgi:ubiquinone/menaquinone biosynthesis C-methylase UbiE
MTDPKREHWDKVYSERREDEVSWFQALPGTSLELIGRTRVPPNAKIVEVGGGASRLVDALLDAGYQDIVVVDLAAAALAKAKARLANSASRVKWVTSDVTRWKPEARFDVWHDRAVFHFMVGAEDRKAYREAMLRGVKPGGHVIIGTFASDGPERCSGLPVQRYEPDTLAAELGPDLELVESVREEHVTPGGNVQRFQFSRFVRA